MKQLWHKINTKYNAGLLLFTIVASIMAYWTHWMPLWGMTAVAVGAGIVFRNQLKTVFYFIRDNYWIKLPLYVIMVFLAAIFCRVFLFEIYHIPSGSMQKTLHPGDKIIVNKLVYGPRIPNSLHDVPWLKVFASGKNKTKLPERRKLDGFDTIRRNDVVVFDHPQRNHVYVKRCVGLPGENIHLQGEQLRINGEIKSNPENVLHEYRIFSSQPEKLHHFFTNIGLKFLFIGQSIRYSNMPTTIKEKLLTNALADSIKLMTKQLKQKYYRKSYQNNNILFNQKAYPRFISNGNKRKQKWTNFNFGPLYIPQKGEKIKIDTQNIRIYRNIIEKHEGHVVTINDGKIYIDQHSGNSYTFKQNYYFMLGDNRCNSLDSRSWGFVPEDYIIGKATSVLFSFADGTMKRKRIMKNIY